MPRHPGAAFRPDTWYGKNRMLEGLRRTGLLSIPCSGSAAGRGYPKRRGIAGPEGLQVNSPHPHGKHGA